MVGTELRWGLPWRHCFIVDESEALMVPLFLEKMLRFNGDSSAHTPAQSCRSGVHVMNASMREENRTEPLFLIEYSPQNKNDKYVIIILTLL